VIALPDPRRSRAVLIGASAYSHLENLPAVHNNLAGFRNVLIDPALGGLPADKCTILEEPPSGLAVYRALRTDATAAEDTLLVYFAGHGRTGTRNELYLCLPDSNPDELSFTALAYEHLREAVADSRATKKVVILDCCFSGRALADQAGDEERIVGQVGIEGSYILTATVENAVALAPPGERYTAFTGTLLNLLRTGIPDGPELLSLSVIYRSLRFTLISRGLPQPRQQGSDTITHLALTRNPAYSQHALTPHPTAAVIASHAYSVRSAENTTGRTAKKAAERARSDPRRAERLLTDAERIARSINGGSEKASALRDVAVALAGTNPRRAKGITRSITNEFWKAVALSDVAKALAAIDRRGAVQLLASAERTARSITNEFWKAVALSDVAKALPVTDPDRVRLLTDAERFARSVTAGYWKAEALRHVAEALAATDPDRVRLLTDAERIARSSITDANWRPKALYGIAKALAVTDPDRAARIAKEVKEVSGAQIGVAEALAATDPERGERLARSITDECSKAIALSDVAKALPVTDPDRVRLLTDAERIARSITDEPPKRWALSKVVEALAATDPDRAERLADESGYTSARGEVAKALAATDPDRAELMANSIDDEPSRVSALLGIAKVLAATASQASSP
jgi:hypothetical protein